MRKSLLVLFALIVLTGCMDSTVNGSIEVHLTDAGIVVNCVSIPMLENRNRPTLCSPVTVRDERTKK